VAAAQVRRVEVRPVDPEQRIPLELDGETPGYLPATFEVVPGALKLRF
jgi:diacylglycerol kinase family enzyme